jgi:WD40 repeat protein
VKIWDIETGKELSSVSLQGIEQNPNGRTGRYFYTPDRKRIAISTSRWDEAQKKYLPGEFKVWETATGKEIMSRHGVVAGTNDADYSSDSRLMAVPWENRSIKIWDLDTGEERMTLPGNSQEPEFIAFSPDSKQLASAGGHGDAAKNTAAAGAVKLWDVQTGRELRTIPGKKGAIVYAAFTPDGQRLAIAEKKSIQIHDCATGQELLSLTMGEEFEGVAELVFNADGTSLIGTSDRPRGDGELAIYSKLWSIPSGQELLPVKEGRRLFFSPDGKRVAAVDLSKSRTEVYEAHNGRLIAILPGDTSSKAFSADGKRLVTKSDGAKLWDVDTGEVINHIKGFNARIGLLTADALTVSLDGKRLIGFDGGGAKVWNLEKKQESSTTLALPALNTRAAGYYGGNTPVAFSADFTRIAGTTGNAVKVFDTATQRELRTFATEGQWTRSVAMSASGKRVAGCGPSTSADGPRTGCAKVWDVGTGKELFSTTDLEPNFQHVAFSPDGSRLAASSGDRLIKVWDLQTGRKPLVLGSKLRGGGHTFTMFAFSPDGKRIAGPRDFSGVAGSMVFSSQIWDADSGDEIVTLNGAIDCSAFSPDGKRVLCGASRGECQIWNAETGEPIVKVGAGDGRFGSVLMESLTFSPNGKRLASVNRILGADTGLELFRFGENAENGQAAFSSDGHRLAIAPTASGEITIYDATPLPEKP